MSAPSSAHALGSRYIRFRFNHIELTGFFDRPKFILADKSKPSRRKQSAILPSSVPAYPRSVPDESQCDEKHGETTIRDHQFSSALPRQRARTISIHCPPRVLALKGILAKPEPPVPVTA